ncbi:TPA: tyrosine-type recombinase/integrase [Vibrio fluvialis]
MPLTEKQLKSPKNFPDDKAHNDVADGGGMFVRFYKSRQVAFYYRYRWQGKQAIIKIGNYPTMSLKEARESLARHKDNLANGIDPRFEKGGEEQPWTVKRSVHNFIDSQIKNSSSSGKYKNNLAAMLEKHLVETVGDRLWEDLKPKDWIDVIARCQASSLRTRLLSSIKRITSHLFILEAITSDSTSVIRGNMLPSHTTKNGEVIPYSRLKPLLETCFITGLYRPYHAVWVIQIIMGSRQVELRRIEEQDIDFKERVWTVPPEKSKVDCAIVRPIPDFMIPYFKCLIAGRYDKNSSFLFAEHIEDGTSKPTVLFLSKIKWIARTILGEFINGHRTRSTISTRFADLGIEPMVAEKMLGHVMAGVMGVYNKGQYLEQQEAAMFTWRDAILNWK